MKSLREWMLLAALSATLGATAGVQNQRKCDSVDGSKLIPPKTHTEIVDRIDRAECQAANANRHEAGSVA